MAAQLLGCHKAEGEDSGARGDFAKLLLEGTPAVADRDHERHPPLRNAINLTTDNSKIHSIAISSCG